MAAMSLLWGRQKLSALSKGFALSLSFLGSDCAFVCFPISGHILFSEGMACLSSTMWRGINQTTAASGLGTTGEGQDSRNYSLPKTNTPWPQHCSRRKVLEWSRCILYNRGSPRPAIHPLFGAQAVHMAKLRYYPRPPETMKTLTQGPQDSPLGLSQGWWASGSPGMTPQSQTCWSVIQCLGGPYEVLKINPCARQASYTPC